MYKALDKSFFLSFIGIKPEQVPHTLIVYGGWNPSPAILAWQAKAAFHTTEFFYPLAIDNGFAVTCIYGDPMASEVAHIFSAISVERIIMIGTFGATAPGIDFGHVFIPEQAIGEDGASRAYNPSLQSAPDPILLSIAHEVWGDRTVHGGTIVSTSAMLAETWDIIQDWNQKGYSGVDLETAAIFSVAAHYGIPALAMHTLADNLVEQKTVFDVQESQSTLKKETKEELFRRAFVIAERHRTPVDSITAAHI